MSPLPPPQGWNTTFCPNLLATQVRQFTSTDYQSAFPCREFHWPIHLWKALFCHLFLLLVCRQRFSLYADWGHDNYIIALFLSCSPIDHFYCVIASNEVESSMKFTILHYSCSASMLGVTSSIFSEDTPRRDAGRETKLGGKSLSEPASHRTWWKYI